MRGGCCYVVRSSVESDLTKFYFEAQAIGMLCFVHKLSYLFLLRYVIDNMLWFFTAFDILFNKLKPVSKQNFFLKNSFKYKKCQNEFYVQTCFFVSKPCFICFCINYPQPNWVLQCHTLNVFCYLNKDPFRRSCQPLSI